MQLLLVDKRSYSTQQEAGAAGIGGLIKEQACSRAFVGTVIHCSGKGINGGRGSSRRDPFLAGNGRDQLPRIGVMWRPEYL